MKTMIYVFNILIIYLNFIYEGLLEKSLLYRDAKLYMRGENSGIQLDC